MNGKDRELIDRLYFVEGVDEMDLIDGLRTGYPRWVDKLIKPFYKRELDYLKDWVEGRGSKISSIIWAMNFNKSKDILKRLEDEE